MKNVLLNPCRHACIKSVQTFRIMMMIGIFCLAAFAQASAQQIAVRGKVTDSKGTTLPAVSVQVKGTNIGSNTDVQGAYSINVSSTGTLVFTLLGYNTQEVPVNGKTTIDVVLVEGQQALDEVVVTAFGVTKEKKALGYSVTEVRGEDFTQTRSTNIAQALSGKIAGVDATQINTGAGGASHVIIRGNTSLSGTTNSNNQQPLYVINGMAINNRYDGVASSSGGLNVDRGDGISSINPDDIESITVLKGGAAAALYGSQAANGVILITTKQGKAQKGIGIEFNSTATFGTPNDFPIYQYEYGQGNDGVKPATQAAALSSGRLSYGAKMDGSMVMQFDGVLRPYSPFYVKDNIKNFYRTKSDITNSIAFSGGNQNAQVRLSVSDLRSEEQQPASTYKRKTASLSGKAMMGKNNFITVDANLQYNLENGHNRPNVGYAELNAAWPIYMAANVVDVRNMAPGYNPATGKEIEWNPVPAAVNPYFVTNRIGNQDDRQRFIGQGSLKINFLKNLFIKGSVSRDFNWATNWDFVPRGNAFTPLGYMNTNYMQDDKTIAQVTLNYNATFLKDFTVTASGGAWQDRNYSYSSGASGTQFVVPDFISLSNLAVRGTASRNQGKGGTNSVFGTADFGYKNMLFVGLTGREDWFATLNPGFNHIFYPGVSTSFLLSEAVKLPTVFNSVKLRASWAQVGRATIGAGSINTTYSISTINAYGLPTQSNSATLRNPNIRPLTVTTAEGGFETQLLGNRLGLDVTYYSKKTTNDILTPPISGYSGYSAGTQNMGVMTNKGIEVLLTGTPLKTANFSWDVSYNMSYNKSKIISLAPGITTVSQGGGIGGVSILTAIGLPYASVVATNYRKDVNVVQDFNKTTRYQVAFQDTMGVANPPYTMGMTHNFRYKQFSLDVLLDGKFGSLGYSNQRQYAARFGLTPETLPGRESGLPLTGVDQTGAPFNTTWAVIDLDTYYNQQGSGYTANFIYNTSFVKLRGLNFRYNIPVNKLKFINVQSASFGIVAKNLAILYRGAKIKKAGIDPELAESAGNTQGVGGVKAPNTRDIGFNLSVKF